MSEGDIRLREPAKPPGAGFIWSEVEGGTGAKLGCVDDQERAASFQISQARAVE